MIKRIWLRLARSPFDLSDVLSMLPVRRGGPISAARGLLMGGQMDEFTDHSLEFVAERLEEVTSTLSQMASLFVARTQDERPRFSLIATAEPENGDG
jgi:hypothetical protein